MMYLYFAPRKNALYAQDEGASVYMTVFSYRDSALNNANKQKVCNIIT